MTPDELWKKYQVGYVIRKDDFLAALHEYGPEVLDLLRRETVRRRELDDDLRKDAERYRWLCDKIPADIYYELGVMLDEGTPEELDAAIDAAMGKGE